VITAQVENLTETLEELKPFFPAHWRELGLFQDKMPLDPQYDIYLRRDAAGEALLATLRVDGQVKGYFVGFIAPGLHYGQTLTCTMDIVYIDPDHRSAGNGVMLFDTVKAALRQRGVKLWWVGSKNHKPIEAFFRAFGFKQEEAYFAMWLGD
jgi:GNAT superfamily N-acetyltransferase